MSSRRARKAAFRSFVSDPNTDIPDLHGKTFESTQDVALTAVAPEDTEIRRFDDDASAMQARLSGQVDAIGCSTTVAAQIAKRTPANTFKKNSCCVSRSWA